MARRRSDNSESVSLFPFLSILVCVIGCLTMIIVVINLMQMNRVEGREPEEVERARKFVELKKKKDEQAKDIDEMRIALKDLIQSNEDILQKRERLQRLKETIASNENMNELRDELIVKLNLLVQTNKQLENDQENLQTRIVEMEAEVEKRKLPPDPPSMMVKPSGSGGNVEPYFVEAADGLVRLHKSLSEPPIDIPVASVNQAPEFVQLLERIAAEPYRKLVVLVRANDGSVATYNRLVGVVNSFNQNKDARIIPGKLPLPGEGKVDLSLFAQYLEK